VSVVIARKSGGTRKVGDGLCERDGCFSRKLKGRQFCFDHQLEAEEEDGQGGIEYRHIREDFEKCGEGREVVTLYFIGVKGDATAVKIGYTTGEVGTRLSQLQVGNHRELEVLATMRVPVSFEPLLHEYLANHHIRGEWFWLRDKVVKVVEAAKLGVDWKIMEALR
jgi:hypothetical protein